KLFINNQYVAAKSSERLKLYNPTDDSLVTDDVHVAGPDDVNAAVAAARAAFPGWAATPPGERAIILNKFADLIDSNAETIGALHTKCSGQIKLLASNFELKVASKCFRYYAGWCDKLFGEVVPSVDGIMSIITHEPLGVCAAICAFNAPMQVLSAKTAPALAAGNTVIVKPSEKSPLGALFVGRLAKEAGFPDGVFNVVTGGGPTGALLASHMDINKVSFTGSSATGRKIAQMAAQSNLKRVQLELGGKSPAIIFPDADLATAIEWCIRGFTTISGQACITTSRLYVHKSIREQFLGGLQEGLKQMETTMGDPSKDNVYFGPLVDKIQLERVTGYLKSGKQEATLLYGAKYSFGCFVRPTIFVDSKPDAKVYKEEIFGPVTVVNDFEDEEEVIRRANDTEFGLSGAVFSQDITRALRALHHCAIPPRVASKIHSGTVCVNCTMMNQVEAPFGGVKSSGWGRENGKDGILAFTEPKTTFVKL
ncbi:aldehyde dehydrogenase domain-containing protein, partial [Bipolaris maydis]